MTTTVRVGDIARQVRGVSFAKGDAAPTPRDGFLPVLRAGNIREGRLDFSNLTYVPSHKISSLQRVRKNDVVIAASSGSIDVVGKAARSVSDFEGAFGAFLKVLRPESTVDPGYFAHYFQTPAYRHRISSLAAGANINNIKNEHLNNLEISLPPLDEQRRIAAILDHADALRSKRRQVLAHLDSLTQSIFHEMFGAKSFPATRSDEVVLGFRNGISPATAGTYAADVLTLSAVTGGTFDATAVKPGLFAIEPPADKRVTRHDFLICRGNGNKELVGAGAFSPYDHPNLVFPDTMIAGRVDPGKMTMQFLEAVWKQPSTRRQIEAFARTTNGTYKINQQSLSRVLIPLPPLDIQMEFVASTVRIDAQRAAVERALATDDELFASLQSRAFRGEL